MSKTLETIKRDEKIKVMSEEPYADELLKMYLEHDTVGLNLDIKQGDVVEGTVIGQNKDYILVDINSKDFVMIDNTKNEFGVLEKLGRSSGDKIDVYLSNVNQENFEIKGSFTAIQKQDALDEMIDNSNTEVIIASVKEWNPAGYILDLHYNDYKMQAFMPNTLAGINKLYDPQSIVGKELPVMVESYSEEKGTFIASRKKYLKSLIPQALENLEIVDDAGVPIKYTGTVTGTTKFGIFVEFNECLTGMVHMANLEDGVSLTDYEAGSTITFYVKENIRGKLILTQVWRETLWDTIKKDQEFDATIKEFKKFGALTSLDDETVGLIYTTELEKSNKKYKEGDTVKVKVTDVQRTNRKIYLTIIE